MFILYLNYRGIWALLTWGEVHNVTLEGNSGCRLNKGTTVVCQIEFFIFSRVLREIKFQVK